MDNFHFSEEDEILEQEIIASLDTTAASEEDLPPAGLRHSKKKIWLTIAGVLLFLLAAVLVGSRLLGFSIKPGQMEFTSIGPDGESSTTYYYDSGPEIENDERYPTTEPDLSGICTRREDNSLFIGTGQITMMASMKEGSDKYDLDATHDGPEYEVVITGKTKIYIDQTFAGQEFEDYMDLDSVKQVLEETDTLDGIIKNTTLNVWGKRSGDRYIADTLVYTEPFTLSTAK